MLDKALVAGKIAAVRDATARVGSVLPATVEAFPADRTAREVVTLNVFVAIQDCHDLAAHWLADAGWEMPGAYGEVFAALARHAMIPADLADRLAAAAAFRNLVAHQYGALDWRRVHTLAAGDLEGLEAFCASLAGRGRDQGRSSAPYLSDTRATCRRRGSTRAGRSGHFIGGKTVGRKMVTV